MKRLIRCILPALTITVIWSFSMSICDAQEAKPGMASGPDKTARGLTQETQGRNVEEKARPATLKSRHHWEIGPEISYIEYKEPDVMKEKGMMYGIGAAYTYEDRFMFRADTKLSYGRVDYQNSGSLNDISDYMFEIRVVGGYVFKLTDSLVINPYAGLGYRYLRDDTSGRVTTTGERGYLRESNYLYTPVGVAVRHDLKNSWILGMTVEYDLFWKGKQKSRLSDVNPSYNDLENNQNSGYGLRGTLLIQRMAGRMTYSLEPFIRYWNIDKSDVQNITFQGAITAHGWEPQNTSTEVGLKFSVGF